MDRNYIASELTKVAREMTADYGDATYFMNIGDVFAIPRESDSPKVARLMIDMLSDALLDSRDEIDKAVMRRLKKDRRMSQLEDAGIWFK